MSNSTPTVWLVTGTSRGIGQKLVETIEERSNQTIIAASRSGPSPPKITKQNNGSKIISVRLRGEVDTDAVEVIESIKKLNIDHIDNVIANAGIAQFYGSFAETPVKEIRQHFEVNTVSSILLFQATLPLLRKSKNAKLVYISTAAASMTSPFPLPISAYGASKAAANFVITKIHQEKLNVIAFSISPGWVQTDMGNTGATANGMVEAPVTKEDSIKGILNRIDNATSENSGGKFKDFSEGDIPW